MSRFAYVFRPLGPWLEGNTANRRSRYVMRAGWQNTLDLLARELDYLDARHIVIQADFSESDLRVDGMPRSNARAPYHPGVRIAFKSKHGPLTYATDAYEFWQHNVRAIGLGLEALRAVDRYGVTRRGEQYTGWKQLGAGTRPVLQCGEWYAAGALITPQLVDGERRWVAECCADLPDRSHS
jgi:hypothetical protein